MGEVSGGRSVGTKTFLVLMVVLTVAFLAGLLIMNNNYASLQAELTASKAQASSLQSTLYSLNQNCTLLQEIRNSLLAQVNNLTEQVNQTQVVSRTLGYSITMSYDNRTLFYNDGMGGERAVKSPMVEFSNVTLTPQTGESVVPEPWSMPPSGPQWLEEPETEGPVGIILYTGAIRTYFAPTGFTWHYTYSWDYVEDVYREHHDYYDTTLTGTVQLLYFSQGRNVTLVLMGSAGDLMDQATLDLV